MRPDLLDVFALQHDGAAGRARNIDGDLVKRGQLFFRSLVVGDIVEARDVLQVFTAFSLNDRVLAASNRGKVALESTN